MWMEPQTKKEKSPLLLPSTLPSMEEQNKTRLLVTELGRQKIILGFPWLREQNPDINWKTGEFKWWPQTFQVMTRHRLDLMQLWKHWSGNNFSRRNRWARTFKSNTIPSPRNGPFYAYSNDHWRHESQYLDQCEINHGNFNTSRNQRKTFL